MRKRIGLILLTTGLLLIAVSVSGFLLLHAHAYVDESASISADLELLTATPSATLTPTCTPSATPSATLTPTSGETPAGSGISDGRSDGKSDGRSSDPGATQAHGVIPLGAPATGRVNDY